MEKLYSTQSAKTRLGADCGSDHELIIENLRLKLKKVEETTRLFSSAQFTCSVVSNSLRPHGLQPTRLLCPWDFPGKSTGVGCHCLLPEKHEPTSKPKQL